MATATTIRQAANTFLPMSATRLLLFGGIALVLGGMVFGDIFAVFVLLQNGGRTGETLLAATDAGYLALLLALVQPYVALPSQRKKRLAQFLVIGGVLLPIGIFLIHYVGLSYSPFAVIGWGSVLADAAGALLIVALLGELWGFVLWLRGERLHDPEVLSEENSWSRRALLSGG